MDSHSTDGTVELLREREKKGQLVHVPNHENVGSAHGNKQGLRTALQDDCEYLWLLGSDAIVDPDSLGHLVELGESSKHLGLVAPSTFHRENSSACIDRGVRIEKSKLKWEPAKSHEEALLWHIESPDKFLSNCRGLLIKRETYSNVGELDERYFSCGELEDFCLRAFEKGYECAIAQNARVMVTGNAEEKKPSYFFYRSRNPYLFWKKHSPESGLLKRCWCHRRSVSELLGDCEDRLENMRAVFEGLFSGVLDRYGKRSSSNILVLGICQLFAWFSWALMQAKRCLGKIDRFVLRDKVRPWKHRHMRPKDFFITRTRNRLKLLRKPLPENSQEDVTVILPVRNRYNFRLDNTLNSIRQQDYDADLIKIVLVDYGSDRNFEDHYRLVSEQYEAEYLRVDGPMKWNLSHATNLVLKQTTSKYVLCTGMDLMLSPKFVQESIKQVNQKPGQMHIATMYESPEGLITGFLDTLDMDSLRDSSKLMFRHDAWPHVRNPGINMGLKYYYERIRGYDERYTLWGYEDDDFVKRMELSGLRMTSDNPHIYCIHQYHPIERVLEPEKFNPTQQLNWRMLKNDHTIMRNASGWGDLKKEYLY